MVSPAVRTTIVRYALYDIRTMLAPEIVGLAVLVSAMICSSLISLTVTASESWSDRFVLGHTSAVRDVIITEDEQYAASISGEGDLIAWDLVRGRALWTWEGIVKNCAVFNQKDRVLAAIVDASTQRHDVLRIVYFNFLTGRKSPLGYGGERDLDGLNAVCLSPDGQRILGASMVDGTCKVAMWDTWSGFQKWTTDTRPVRPTAVAFASDRQLAVVGYEDGHCSIIDTEGKLPTWDFSDGTEAIDAVKVSSNGNWLLTLSSSGAVLVHVPDKSIAFRAPKARAACFSPDGSVSLMGLDRGTIGMFETHTASRAAAITTIASASGFSCAKYLPRSDSFLTGSFGGGMTLWDNDGSVTRRFGTDSGFPTDVTSTPDNSHVLVGYSTGLTMQWELRSGVVDALFEGERDTSWSVTTVQCSHDGKLAAVGIGVGGILVNASVWNRESQAKVMNLPIDLDLDDLMMGPLAFSTDDRLLVVGSRSWELSRQVSAWRLPVGQLGGTVRKVAFLPDSRSVIVAGREYCDGPGYIARCALSDLRVVAKVGIGNRTIFDRRDEYFELRPDGDELFVRRPRDWVVFDAQTLAERGTFDLPEEYDVSHLSYYDNAGRVLVELRCGDLLLYDTVQHRVDMRFVGHAAPITCVTRVPDKQVIITGARDKRTIVWNATTGDAIASFLANCSGSISPVSLYLSNTGEPGESDDRGEDGGADGPGGGGDESR